MADSSLILKKHDIELLDDHTLGSYSSALTAQNGLAADDHVRLDEIGIHTTNVINAKKLRSPKFYEHEKKLKWSESYHGRLGLRAISRFGVATAVYAIMQIYVGNLFGGKAVFEDGKAKRNPKTGEKILKEGYSGFGAPKDKNLLKWAAYSLDKTVGKTIKSGVYGAARAIGQDKLDAKRIARAATEFRRNPEYRDNPNANSGRSLGVEMVAVTSDFAAMSAADYITRYVVDLFDKNNKTAWVKDGHLNLKGGLKELGQNIGTAVTYAAGQDMFAALPYVYFMKFQRHFLNKFSPGFEIDSEYQRHGGTLKVRRLKEGERVYDKKGQLHVGGPDEAKNEYKIAGDYNLEGIIEYTGRFTFYNIVTKMYRDLFVNVQEKYHEMRNGVKTPPNPDEPEAPRPRTFVGRIMDAIKYVAVTSTKVSFFMIPSAFVFGTIRASQGKHRTFMISDEVDEKRFTGNGKVHGNLPKGKRVNVIDKDGNAQVIDGFLSPEDLGKFNDPAAGLHDLITNPIARFSWRMSKFYGKTYEGVFGKVRDSTGLAIRHKDGSKFARRWAEGALAYTPYIMLSSDVASQWYDTNRSNFVLSGFFVALGEHVKSLFSFDGKRIKHTARDVKKWGNETWLSMLKQPSPNYEAHIQKAMNDDNFKASNLGFDLNKDEYEAKHDGSTIKGTAQKTTVEEEEQKRKEAVNKEWMDNILKSGGKKSFTERMQSGSDTQSLSVPL